jgi:hypothetical protein
MGKGSGADDFKTQMVRFFFNFFFFATNNGLLLYYRYTNATNNQQMDCGLRKGRSAHERGPNNETKFRRLGPRLKMRLEPE